MSKWLSYLWREWWCLIAFIAMTFGFSLRTQGSRRIPHRGPVLIIANHQSFLDPILLSLACSRRLVFLARKTLFQPPWFAWLLCSLSGVPMDQEGVAKEGLKAVLNYLQAGEAVVVFPEGMRTADGQLSPFKPGVQLLLKRAQAALMPVGIAGAFEALPYWRKIPTLSPLFIPAGKSTIAVWVGQPLDARRFADMPRATRDRADRGDTKGQGSGGAFAPEGVSEGVALVDCSPKSGPGAMRVSETLQGQETNHETTHG